MQLTADPLNKLPRGERERPLSLSPNQTQSESSAESRKKKMQFGMGVVSAHHRDAIRVTVVTNGPNF